MGAAITGSFVGLIVGGLLADVHWRLVFWVNVPFGLFGTVWAYAKLRELGTQKRTRIDWWGNLTFATGLVMILLGITYGLQPSGGHNMGWTGHWVLFELLFGIALLVAFAFIEVRVKDPMFHIDLFRIRAFTAGNVASLLSSIGRGGLQFILIIWLQGIWLPLHGYNFVDTPLWAGIYMLPLTAGLLLAAPAAGWLSDRYGARPFTTGGMLLAAASFGFLMLLPANFTFPAFAALLLLNGIGMGLFAAPNTTGIMNAVPAGQRGAASGMRATFQNTGMVLSIGLFFSLMIIGLSASLPASLRNGLERDGVPAATAQRIAAEPPVGSLFAAFLGYNPMEKLVGKQTLSQLPPAKAADITGKRFFPGLISEPFMDGLRIAFTASMIMCLIAAWASWLRGGRYVAGEDDVGASGMTEAVEQHGEDAPMPEEWVPV